MLSGLNLMWHRKCPNTLDQVSSFFNEESSYTTLAETLPAEVAGVTADILGVWILGSVATNQISRMDISNRLHIHLLPYCSIPHIKKRLVQLLARGENEGLKPKDLKVLSVSSQSSNLQTQQRRGHWRPKHSRANGSTSATAHRSSASRERSGHRPGSEGSTRRNQDR